MSYIQFALPGKQEFANQYQDDAAPEHVRATSSDNTITGNEDDQEDHGYAAESATETTPLRAEEQGWLDRATSRRLRAPTDGVVWATPDVDLGNLGLIQTASMAMTGADGGSLLTPLMGIGVVTIFLLLPLTPFAHRVTRHEVIDVDAGTNVASLSLSEYVHAVVASVPSAAGQEIKCRKSSTRSGLTACEYDASSLPPYLANGTDAKDLIKVTGSRSSNGKTANLKVDALDSKMCILNLSQPVFGFEVKNAAPPDRRFGSIPHDGLRVITIFRREWEGPWDIKLQLTDEGRTLDREGLEVTVRCAYSDMNDQRTIPVLLCELYQYMPKWTVISKTAVGLVEVRKKYTVS
ncbi:hypothetical protein Trco_007493 [Trichoderma cornu-damae]|uniref:Uncharacterized protein n=1 Tax=Trichoderma cornu-damae TaxID=654480 RepID=A0A9P8QKK5_9HYPO|nr:hypothetical protein Trco_007493 [Trichoderma cornu-damae]